MNPSLMRLRPFAVASRFQTDYVLQRFCCTDACHGEIDGVLK